MIPEHRPYFTALSDARIMALCIWAEARGEIEEGRLAVGSVVLNRADYGKMHDAWGRRFGTTISTVVLAPAQFSWTMATDPQYGRCVEIARGFDAVLKKAYRLEAILAQAEGLVSGAIDRNVKALYYHTTAIRPKWSRNMKVECTIGNHIFYEG